MKRCVGLLSLLLVLFSFQTVGAYELIINATSDVEYYSETYNFRYWDLESNFEGSSSGSVSQSKTLTLPAGNFVLSGYTRDYENHINKGHFYYGPYDELTIITLNEDNPSETINIHIVEGDTPEYFNTYEEININGHAVIPLFYKLAYSTLVKQLVYENEDNDIMLVGYQKYTSNGWETVIADQEYLYLDNDADAGESFTHHNYLGRELDYSLSPSPMTILGEHEIEVNGNIFTTKAVFTSFETLMDCGPYHYLYEFTGNNAPLARNLAVQGTNRVTLEDYSYLNESFNPNKLINLTPNTETIYKRDISLDPAPRNLTCFGNTFYWYPQNYWSSIIDGRYINQVFYWQHDFNNETLIDSLVVSSSWDALIFDQANLLHTNYSFWLKGIFENGFQTQATNIISWTPVANEENTIPALIKLGDNYPNPFNPETTISFNLDRAAYTNLDIYNVLGQKVRTLLNGYQSAGEHSLVWNGKDDQNNSLASGIYLYKLKQGKYSSTKKMILLK